MAIVRDIEPWDELLDGGQGGRAARAPGDASTSASRSMVELPAELHPDVLAALRAARDRLALEPSGRGAGVSVRADHDRHHRHRLGQVAVLPAADAATCSRATARARALFLYPSKALAQDQARSLHAFGLKRARPAIYDGDTPREQRADAAPQGQPGPHQPGHAARRDPAQPRARGATSSRNLAVVVIDEAHVYRGVFGSHVANVLRRLRRICELHGTSPRFLLASATIANPGELASRLTGLDDVNVISRDGSPGTQAHDRDVEPAGDRRGDRWRGARRWPRRRTCSPSS